MHITFSRSPIARQEYNSKYSPIKTAQKERQQLKFYQRSSFKSEQSTQPKEISYFKDSRYKSIISSQHQSSNGYNQKSPKKGQKQKISRMRQILQEITNQQSMMSQRVKNLQRQKQNRSESVEMEECTFIPRVNHNPKYHINSIMEDRNRSWDEARVKNFTTLSQEVAQTHTKQCTFNPHMIAYNRSKQILKKKQLKQCQQRQRQPEELIMKVLTTTDRCTQRRSQSPITPQYTFNDIKQLIRGEMNRIAFSY